MKRIRIISTLIVTSILFVSSCSKFTIVILPDTQYYSLRDERVYNKQTEWIVNHKEIEQIEFVIHLGDFTHENGDKEWDNALAAHSKLDGKIPYSVVPGNHDNPETGHNHRNTGKFNDHFGVIKFSSDTSWYKGHMDYRNDNNYCYFKKYGLKFLILSLEFAPTKDALCWANEILKQHPDHRVIIVTHCYSDSNGEWRQDCATEYDIIGSSGMTVWNELAKSHSNVFMILSGHIAGSFHGNNTVSEKDSQIIHEILTDFQYEKKKNGEYNGNGWMKLLTFYPKKNLVKIRTVTALEAEGVDTLNYSRYPHHPWVYPNKDSFEYNMKDPMPPYRYNPTYSGFSDRTINGQFDGGGERHQLKPAAAMASNGDFVVVWEDDSHDPAGTYQIYAREFYANGCEKLSSFVVNDDPAGQQLRPDIAMNPDGSFIVVWEDDSKGIHGGGPNDKFQIYAAGFDGNGNKIWGDKTVNTDASGQQYKPDVAVGPDGSIIVVWEDDSKGPGGSGPNDVFQIYAAKLDRNGNKIWGDKTVNTDEAGQQYRPEVAICSDGSFIVVWEDDSKGPGGSGPDGTFQIYAAKFDKNGNKLWGDKTVNSSSAGQQLKPALAAFTSGNFVVAWEDSVNLKNKTQIYAAGFDKNGNKIWADRKINKDDPGSQLKPAIAVNPDGQFIIAWEDDSKSPGGGGPNGIFQIYGAGFDINGNKKWEDRVINTDDNGQQLRPSVAMSTNGYMVILWQDDVNDNDWYDIVGRGFNINELY